MNIPTVFNDLPALNQLVQTIYETKNTYNVINYTTRLSLLKSNQLVYIFEISTPPQIMTKNNYKTQVLNWILDTREMPQKQIERVIDSLEEEVLSELATKIRHSEKTSA